MIGSEIEPRRRKAIVVGKEVTNLETPGAHAGVDFTGRIENPSKIQFKILKELELWIAGVIRPCRNRSQQVSINLIGEQKYQPGRIKRDSGAG